MLKRGSFHGVVTVHPEKKGEYVVNLPAFIVERHQCEVLTDEDMCALLETNIGAFYHSPSDAHKAVNRSAKEWVCGILAGLRMLEGFEVKLEGDDGHCRISSRDDSAVSEVTYFGAVCYDPDDKVVDEVEALVKRLKERAVRS